MFDQPQILPLRPTRIVRFVPSDPHPPVAVDQPVFEESPVNIIELPD